MKKLGKKTLSYNTLEAYRTCTCYCSSQCGTCGSTAASSTVDIWFSGYTSSWYSGQQSWTPV